MLGLINRLKNEGKKIGFTASTFDLLHTGHIAMLSEAKSHCDFLIIGLLTDPTNDRPETKNKPIQSIFERWMQVQALYDIDLIIPFDSEKDLYDMLLVLQPHIRFVGEEYRGSNFTGHDIESIEIYYNSRKHTFSTSDLRQRIQDSGILSIKEEDKIKEIEKLAGKIK